MNRNNFVVISLVLTGVASLAPIAGVSGQQETTTPAGCSNNAPMINCLIYLMDPTIMSKMKDFQGITPLVLVTDNATQLQSRLQTANTLCRAVNSSKICAGSNRIPVPWWNCPALLAQGASILISLKSYFMQPGMPDIDAPRIKSVMEMADQLCFSPNGLPALLANQVCLTSALRRQELTQSVADMTRIFLRYSWDQRDCSTVQHSTLQILGAIEETCVGHEHETRMFTYGVFLGSLKLLTGYSEDACPPIPLTAPSATTAAQGGDDGDSSLETEIVTTSTKATTVQTTPKATTTRATTKLSTTTKTTTKATTTTTTTAAPSDQSTVHDWYADNCREVAGKLVCE